MGCDGRACLRNMLVRDLVLQLAQEVRSPLPLERVPLQLRCELLLVEKQKIFGISVLSLVSFLVKGVKADCPREGEWGLFSSTAVSAAFCSTFQVRWSSALATA